MNIPDKAVEAAARELYYEERNTSEAETPWPEWDNLPFEPTWDGKEPYRELARAALKAAAPFIAAQALRDAARAESSEADWSSNKQTEKVLRGVADRLVTRASKSDPQ